MIVRSAGLALLLATSLTQAETASISASSKIESNVRIASGMGRTASSASDVATTAAEKAAADRIDAIDGGLPQISEELSRELEKRLARETQAQPLDLLPAPVLKGAPKVASIRLP